MHVRNTKGFSRALCAFSLAGALVARADVSVYRTDFSTRTSAKAIPSAAWASSAPYHTGTLMRNYSYSLSAPFDETDKVQDGWAKGNDGNHDYEADFVVRADGDNQFAAFINSGTVTDPSKDHNTRAVQPFYNSVSTGVLRIQVDLRAPSSYPVWGNNNFFFGPYYRKYVNLNWGSGGVPSRPGMFGFNFDQGSGVVKTYIYGGDGKGGFDGAFGKAITAGHWYRFVVDFNFESKTLSGTALDLGTATPTFATTGTAFETLATKHLHTDPNAADGPVEGFCLADCGSVSGRDSSEDLTKAPCVDNIRFWWKASGTDFGADDLLYENDFSVRRGRTIVTGSSSTSAVYAAPGGVITNTFDRFAVNSYAYPDLTAVQLTAANLDSGVKATHPYGFDGWRRLNSAGTCKFSVSNPGGNGGNRLVVSGHEQSGQFGIIAQALGTRITTGDVKFSFDFRLPDQWYDSSRWFYAMLAGDDYLNSSTDDDQASRYVVRLGVRSQDNKDNTFNFACRAAGENYFGDAAIKNHYYRGVVTVHLDANPRTVDVVMYDLGMGSVDGAYEVPSGQSPVYARTGDTINNSSTFQNISCIAFYAAGVRGMYQTLGDDSLMFIDNLKVWKKAASATDWTAVYYNDFSTRTRYLSQAKPVPLLTSDIGRFGMDGWVKRNNAANPLLITAGIGENPALYADDVFVSDTALTAHEQRYAWAVQQLGTRMKRGTFTVRADLRPPRTWTAANKTASLVLGNDLYFEGTPHGDHQFLNEYQVRFGFTESGGTANTFGRYGTTKAYYTSSNGAETMSAAIDPTHWYRFVAKADISAGTYDLNVYDLGTAHPTFATATPATALGSVKGIAFRNALGAGEAISTLGVTAEGTMNERPWETDDPGVLLIDNLSIDHQPSGLTVIVR